MSTVYFATAIPERLDRDLTLPARFQRLLARLPLLDRIRGKTVAIKMHLGGGLGYSTIHPLFVKLLVDHLKKGEPRRIFATDCGSLENASDRGYTKETIGCDLVPALGIDNKDVTPFPTGWDPLPEALLGKPLLEADILINLSHLKGHGDCGFGAACKNLAMGCVPYQTRKLIHSLEGDLAWDKKKCIRCNKCIEECEMKACEFTKEGDFSIFWHHCKMCQHCMLICPTKAITLTGRNFPLFQEGLARIAKLVIDRFGPENVVHINFLTHITIFCDCWGFTTPALVPDVGVFASDDIVAVEDASLQSIKTENLIPGSITPPYRLGEGGHLFEKIHERDPYLQVRSMEALGLGSRTYQIEPIA